MIRLKSGYCLVPKRNVMFRQNPNVEYRSPKQIRMSNNKMTNTYTFFGFCGIQLHKATATFCISGFAIRNIDQKQEVLVKHYYFFDFSNACPTYTTICSNQAISFSEKGISLVLAIKYAPMTPPIVMMGEIIAVLKARFFCSCGS
jgi:hypothetical protein